MKTLLLILAIPLCVAAQAPASSPLPATNEPTTGTITGKVVNEAGQPMPGASAFVRAVNASTSRTTITDSDGNFQVSGLEPALYTIGASAPAYTTIPSDPNTPPVYYRIGDTARLELVRGGVITGMVTNALGEPVIAVRVRAMLIRDAKGQVVRDNFGGSEQSTDDRGIYRMFGLRPGTYLVSAGGFGGVQTFQFNPYDSDVPTYAPSSTRDNAVEVSVRTGEESSVDIRYRAEPGYTISGTVKYSGTTGASVTLTPVGNFLPAGNVFQAPASRGFAFLGIADGEYQVVAQEIASATANPPVFSLSEVKTITVKGASVGGIELVTKPLASVSGKIALEHSKVPECQGKRPPLFQETVVQVRRPAKDAEKENSPFMRIFGFSATPDQNGAFVLRNIMPGRYQFDPRFFARYWYLQSITIGGAAAATGAKTQAAQTKTDAAANWVSIKFGEQVSNLTVTIAEGAASIRGKLASAEPAPGMSLYLVPSETDKAEDVLRFFVTEIAADGTFVLNNLPPGKYWALAQTNADAQTATLLKLRLPETAPARIKLRKTAETQKTEIELKPCQNVTDYKLKF